ncbi:amidohydrolase family protein [Sphingobacterium hungaricum]|uniref:Amidohydrolase n=1 Tax=Sphingobacterium hungaricum TaxID=2082723 RepID=A0A928UTU5_9SPHI|nr:amidohydrolase family protein [Sphingobacterium hungaricum]MBE8713110.1 amidohydrolase [Sphingobacterium hungaricum]
MIKYYSADFILPVNAPAMKQGVVAIDESGVVQGVYHSHSPEVEKVKIKKLNGVLVPGFVNAHCHLELSHLEGKIDKGNGLISFLSEVMEKRESKESKIVEKMIEADKKMFENGIQVVGDHVNTAISAPIKENSKIKYHTFVEIIALKTEDGQEKIDEAKDVEFNFDHAHSSITPHAPYSCSKNTFKLFKRAVSDDNIISIHNQESEEENKLFRYKNGEFIDFYDKLGISMDDFKAQARNSIQSYLPYLPINNKLILVHNTFTSLKDLDFVDRMNRDIIICMCPKSNLFIENKLPKIQNFAQDNRRIVIGTDSLASNNTLDILEELKAIHKEFPELDFKQTIKWATLNGAEALNLEKEFGSIEVGKKPGLVLLKGMKNLQLTPDVKLQRIV